LTTLAKDDNSFIKRRFDPKLGPLQATKNFLITINNRNINNATYNISDL